MLYANPNKNKILTNHSERYLFVLAKFKISLFITNKTFANEVVKFLTILCILKELLEITF